MKVFVAIWRFLTFAAAREHKEQARRRPKYDQLKAEISKRHFEGYAGLIVPEDWGIDDIDLKSFKQPMYWVVKNRDWKWCIFWDRAKMIQEIGTGKPLREGEVIAVDMISGRLKPQAAVDVDEQRPLVTPAAPNGQTEDV